MLRLDVRVAPGQRNLIPDTTIQRIHRQFEGDAGARIGNQHAIRRHVAFFRQCRGAQGDCQGRLRERSIGRVVAADRDREAVGGRNAQTGLCDRDRTGGGNAGRNDILVGIGADRDVNELPDQNDADFLTFTLVLNGYIKP